MCATVVWAVNQAAFSESFEQETQRMLGVAPQPTEHRIASSRVRPTSVHFSLTRNMCDCDGLVGLRGEPLRAEETSADSLIEWVRSMPTFAPHVSRLAVLRAWNPQSMSIKPERSRTVKVEVLEEILLRSVGDDTLLAIDYAR